MNDPDVPSVSIVIPCYNGIGKIEKCLYSLKRIEMPSTQYEVVFVDDCSSDGTFEMLADEVEQVCNWRLFRLEENSGSPSRPRNRGIENAFGKYIFFLDSDDEILPDTLKVHLEHAERTGADIVRGYLLVDNGKRRTSMNRLQEWDCDLSFKDKLKLIVQNQSTTTPSLIRANILKANVIIWPERIRMGEDTIFLVDVLSVSAKIEYVDHPTFVYNKSPGWKLSSTQHYGDRELRNHLTVWQEAERKLNKMGLSYYELRLNVGLQYALRSLIWRRARHISDASYEALAEFVRINWKAIQSFNLNPRLQEVVATLKGGDIVAVRNVLRARLVISGYDLKFILPLVPKLEERYEVRIDEWSGHAAHDEKQSEALLDWAEIVWCEWLLENAVWWSHRKTKDQVLVVRMHRFELMRDYGQRVKTESVDCFFCVSVLYVEKLIQTFGYDRQSVRLLPNVVQVDQFRTDFCAERLNNLAIIGILPARKGLKNAVRLLTGLRERAAGVRLHVYGKRPEEVSWVWGNRNERGYFEACQQLIEEQQLEESIIFHGHVDIPQALHEHKIGFVLSVSESSNVSPFESFHLAPAEGFASGGQGVMLDWDGVEFIYPNEYIFPSVTEMADYILSQSGAEVFLENSRRGRDFIARQYNADRFLDLVSASISEYSS